MDRIVAKSSGAARLDLEILTFYEFIKQDGFVDIHGQREMLTEIKTNHG